WLTGSSSPHPCSGRPRRSRRFAVRLLLGWTVVSLLGMVAGAVSLKLPPSRFLALLVAVPGATCLGLFVAFDGRWIARWIRRAGRLGRAGGRWAADGLVIAAAAALAVPAALRWYGYPMLIDPVALQEAQT